MVANVVDGVELNDEYQSIINETDRDSLRANDKILFDFLTRRNGAK